MRQSALLRLAIAAPERCDCQRTLRDFRKEGFCVDKLSTVFLVVSKFCWQAISFGSDPYRSTGGQMMDGNCHRCIVERRQVAAQHYLVRYPLETNNHESDIESGLVDCSASVLLKRQMRDAAPQLAGTARD